MSSPREPKPSKLLIGAFMKDKSLFQDIFSRLVDQFGPADMISPWLPFDYTSYYEPEMGAPLYRRAAAFKQLIAQERLPEIKLFTNSVESGFTESKKRRVNIDPGYMTPERFVLATGKNFTHRIYIGRGVYADLTLVYQRGAFEGLPWTYPDYLNERMLKFLYLVRNKYRIDMKGHASAQ